MAGKGKVTLAYITGWIWLIGNWTITLSVNFGFASLIAGTVSMYHPDFTFTAWQLLLIFYACCIGAFVICAFGNKWLPMVDTAVAAWTALSIVVTMVALSVVADSGRHSASYALGHYDKSFSGWGGFTFFIGLLPAAYCFSAIGMISSMAEECKDAPVKVRSRALEDNASIFFLFHTKPKIPGPQRYQLVRARGRHRRSLLHHPHLRHAASARRHPRSSRGTGFALYLQSRHGLTRRRPGPHVPRAGHHSGMQHFHHQRRFALHVGYGERQRDPRRELLGSSGARSAVWNLLANPLFSSSSKTPNL